MKHVDRKIKKNKVRLNRFYSKNMKRILNSIVYILKKYEHLRVPVRVICYNNGDIDDPSIQSNYKSNSNLLGCIKETTIHVFVDRVIESSIKFQNIKNKSSIYRIFISGLSFVTCHEFYHIKEYLELSKEEFQKLINTKKEIGEIQYKKDREKYANTNAKKLVDKYINYIYKYLKI